MGRVVYLQVGGRGKRYEKGKGVKRNRKETGTGGSEDGGRESQDMLLVVRRCR